ncbi:hypothetical protein R1sor_006323 [Riccia sorocarpa]|uniref:Uncharacterized protein n=1 Tax=Riccia sorocarpa TaxID=122646 RepID=A0ABD3HMA4_9MARC
MPENSGYLGLVSSGLSASRPPARVQNTRGVTGGYYGLDDIDVEKYHTWRGFGGENFYNEGRQAAAPCQGLGPDSRSLLRRPRIEKNALAVVLLETASRCPLASVSLREGEDKERDEKSEKRGRLAAPASQTTTVPSTSSVRG